MEIILCISSEFIVEFVILLLLEVIVSEIVLWGGGWGRRGLVEFIIINIVIYSVRGVIVLRSPVGIFIGVSEISPQSKVVYIILLLFIDVSIEIIIVVIVVGAIDICTG